MTDTDDLLQRLRNSPPREICEHGSQRVKCPHCEINVLDAKIILLTDENERLRAEVERLQFALNFWMPAIPGDGDDPDYERAVRDAGLLIGLQGFERDCYGDRMVDRLAEQTERATRAESELAALRARIDQAPANLVSNDLSRIPANYVAAPVGLQGKLVKLLVEPTS